MPPARATAATRTSEAMIATFGKPDAVTGPAASTVMSFSTVADTPNGFVTFSVTRYVPAEVYCLVVCQPSPYVPSPKSQWYTREPVRSQLPFAVNVTSSEAWIGPGATLKAATGRETTVMSDEVVTAMPSSSTTVRWTVYVPGYAYRWVNVEPSPTAPSPSCQTWRTIFPSGSELRLALKDTASPTNGREGVKARTANGDFGGTTEMVIWKDAVALWSSQTTNITEYVPVAPKTWLMTELPSVEFPPSPKFHSYRTIRPSGSFEADPSKTRGVPTLPKGRAVVNVAFGGLSTYREADELFLPLKLSVTVKVTVYRPPRA